MATLVVSDATGTVTPLKLPPGPYQLLRVSPDGRRLAVGVHNGPQDVHTRSLWSLVRDGREESALTGVESRQPIVSVFSPDGRWGGVLG